MLRPLRSAVASWKPGREVAADPLVAVREAWAAVAGTDVAAHSRPVEIAHGALLVVTRSSAWSQQLGFMSERIVAAVNEAIGRPEVERVRFRVGRLDAASTRGRALPGRLSVRPRPERLDPAPTLEAAVERFRSSVTAAQRAKAAAGWKECVQCGAWVAPAAGRRCVSCENAETARRAESVARLLYEVPWIGYAGIAEIVEGLTQQEYQSIRRRLLGRWWDVLCRARRSGRRALTQRERLVASSYVLLKSELDPERIAPAVVRDLLGDELHEMLNVNENY
ncbi:MAG: DciA family protein [Vulcanimicrobiaceae bacterium]